MSVLGQEVRRNDISIFPRMAGREMDVAIEEFSVKDVDDLFHHMPETEPQAAVISFFRLTSNIIYSY